MRGQQVEAAQIGELDFDQEVTIIATSGSQRRGEGAVHTWGNHFYSAKFE